MAGKAICTLKVSIFVDKDTTLIFKEVIIIKPTILLLGTHHFSAHDNGDLFRPEKDDMLSETRQIEIEEVIGRLKDFRPTKIALEAVEGLQGALNEGYQDFLSGQYILGVNEIEQIGYRLAKDCSLPAVHAVDWNEDEEDVPEMSDLSTAENGKYYDAAMQIGQEITSDMEAFFKEHTYRELLLWLNAPEQVAKGHEIYMKMALAGGDEHPAGALWTAKYWYYRNLLIYKNLIKLIESDEERIFVLYGAGHLHLLGQFLKESNLVEVEVAHEYLS